MGAIDTAFVKQFSDNIALLAQQKGSRLRSAVTVESGIVGEKKFVDQIGPATATRKTTRLADTPYTEPSLTRRMITMYDWEYAPIVDRTDLLKMLTDPRSKLSINAINALGRAMDDEIITALGGTAYTGKEGSTSVALPSAQKIAVASSGLTIAKLIAAKKKLDQAEVDVDDPRFCVCTAEQIEDMLGTTQVTSVDYSTVKALVKGEVDTFLGFKFIRSERLVTDGTNRLAYCFARSGICLGIAKDIFTRVDEIPTKGYATAVYASMGIGAARLEEEKVVQIACKE